MSPSEFKAAIETTLGQPLRAHVTGFRRYIGNDNKVPFTKNYTVIETGIGLLQIACNSLDYHIQIVLVGAPLKPLPEGFSAEGEWKIGTKQDGPGCAEANLKTLARRLGLAGYVPPAAPDAPVKPGEPGAGLSFTVEEIDGETRVSVNDGKYTVIHKNGENFRALRHGEPWNRDLVGDNLVYWMACALVEADARIKKQDTGLPRINIRCETQSGRLQGRTSLNVVRVEQEDDGSFTAVTDHWPQDPKIADPASGLPRELRSYLENIVVTARVITGIRWGHDGDGGADAAAHSIIELAEAALKGVPEKPDAGLFDEADIKIIRTMLETGLQRFEEDETDYSGNPGFAAGIEEMKQAMRVVLAKIQRPTF